MITRIIATLLLSTVLTANTAILMPEQIEPRYGFTADEIYLLAQVLCGDAGIDGDGEYDFVWQVEKTPDKIRYDQISLVLCVIMNRVRSETFPNTVKEVIFQRNQFAGMSRRQKTIPHDIAIEKIKEWCEAYDRGDPGAQSIPEDHLYFSGNGRINKSRARY